MGMPGQSLEVRRYQGALWVVVNFRDGNVIARMVVDEQGQIVPYQRASKRSIPKAKWAALPTVDARSIGKSTL